jgi:hypothetical protein
MIDDATENRDSSQEELDNIEPDKEPTQDMVDNLVDSRVNDALSDPINFIRSFGLDVKDFVNEKELAQALVDADGWGIMNSYDGQYDSGVKRWYCSDEEGLNCYLYMSTADSKTGIISIGLEYDDLAYYYRGRQE